MLDVGASNHERESQLLRRIATIVELFERVNKLRGDGKDLSCEFTSRLNNDCSRLVRP